MISLYQYRQYILKSAWADLRHRYTGTGLGIFWNVISPLMQIAVYAVVFTQVMKVHMPGDTSPTAFVIYLCSGMLPWIAFNDCVTRGMNSFVENASYLKKLPIPEQIFVAQNAVSTTFSLGISLGLLVIIATAMGRRPDALWLLVPVACVLWQAFGFGLGLLLGTLNVFIRDISQIVHILFQVWMWTVPVVYIAITLPEDFQKLLVLNPVYPFLYAVHDLLAFSRLPPFWVWPAMLGWTSASILAGWLTLHALRPEIRDVL